MATPQVSDKPEVEQQYLAQLAISTAAAQSLASLWGATNPLDSADALARFASGANVLMSQFAGASSSVATDYYRNLRRSAGLADAVRVPQVVIPPPSVVDAGIRWATRERPAEVADVEPIDPGAAALADIQAKIQKAIDDAARDWIVQAVEGDDRALGYRRIARPGACYWCLSLAIRSTTRKGLATDWAGKGRDVQVSESGAAGDKHYGVYKSRVAAGQTPVGSDEVNTFHDNCHCTVEPIFSAGDMPADWVLEMDRFYADSTEHSAKGQHLNDFRRALNARRRGEEPAAPAPTPITPAAPPADQINAILDRLNAAMAA